MSRLRVAWMVLVVAWIAADATGAGVSTVDLALTGQAVRADVYAPERAATGAVVIAHGFLRSRETMAGHATALARDGYLVVVPDLPYRTDSRENARALVELVGALRAGVGLPPTERIVLVGFSAGGLSALLAAAAPGVVGYVGLDAFDRPGGVGLAAARVLRTPAVLLRGPSSFCNAYGIAEPWTTALPALIERQAIEHASHCDFEAPTDRWCTLLCGAVDPARQHQVRTALLAAVRRLLPRVPEVPISAPPP